MSDTVATYAFEHLDDWPEIPDGLDLVEVPGVAVNSVDDVYVLTRNPEHPIMIFRADGSFITSFGQGTFTNRAHGISIGPDDTIYCADDGTHTITSFSPSGDKLLTLGTPGQSAARWSGKPFNRPTHATPSPTTGDLFVTDGYGNACVHRFDAGGKHLKTWGESGIEAGNFIIPHDVVVDDQERVYVADRECHRIQVFSPDGALVDTIHNIHRPDGLALGRDGNLYVAELCGAVSGIADAPNVGHRVSILSRTGDVLARYGGATEGERSGQFTAPHGIAVDSCGDIYVSEVAWSVRGQYLDPPRRIRCLSKLRRLSSHDSPPA